MSFTYLGKDTKHVFRAFEWDHFSIPPRQVTLFLPALRIRDDEGEESLIHMKGDFVDEPMLVKIDEIAHLVSPAALASMTTPDIPPWLVKRDETLRTLRGKGDS